MQFFALAAAVLPVLAANAVIIPIKVGDGGLMFNPTSVTANVGDTLQFQFVSGNHSVAQSTFADPCTPFSGGVVSGFQNVVAGQSQQAQWSILMNDTSVPLWFYCQQTTPKNHCQNGMVFAVNPTADKTFAAFQQAAMGTGNATASGSSSAAAPGATGASAPGTPAASGSGSAGAVSTGSAGASAGAGSTSSAPAGPASQSSTGSAPASSSTSTNNNAGMKVAGSAASFMAVIGLVAGLAL
jgi:hypothetical protein